MQAVFLILSVAAATFAEFVSPVSVGGVAFPFIAVSLIFWFWRISLSARLILGILLGFLLDGFHTFPPGTYLLVFLIEAFLVDFLRIYFSDTKLPVIQGISMGIMLAVFPLLTIAGSAVLGRITSEKVYWEGVVAGIAAGTLFWTLTLSLLTTGLTRYFANK
jgi:cell shape-determining protein MreD